MPWSAGNFTRTNGVNSGTDVWEQDKLEPVNILASRADYHDNDLATGINACVNKDGSNATNVVATAWIQDSAVTTAKIADGTITEAKLADDAATRSCCLAVFQNSSAFGEGSFAITAMTKKDLNNSLSIMPKAGKVTHITAVCSAGLASGTITFTLYKNLVTTTKTITAQSSDTHASVGCFRGSITAETFAAGDRLSSYVTFSSVDWASATTADCVVEIWGHFTE